MSQTIVRVVAAMSGGVDSSVAAALLVEQGFDVVGVSMQVYDQREGQTGFGSCCSLDDLQDARRVAAALGIPHYVLNLQRRFQETVLDDFVAEYRAGRTPLPCAHCNTDLKFAELVERARGFGAAAVATGHYARVVPCAAGGPLRLLRGADAAKDQSYFLFGLTQAQLARAMFPLGALAKPAVRELARARGLPVADKPDSQEICFVPGGDYAALVDRAGSSPGGEIVDQKGRVLARHAGIHRFTVGQRKGLNLSVGVPLYVVALSAETGRVTVGPREALERLSLTASQVNWIAGSPPREPRRLDVQIRSRHRAAPARVSPDGDSRATVLFDERQAAITPGQAAVFYDGDEVVGGGWIEKPEMENEECSM